MAILLELPVPVVERANLPSLEPPGDAMEVEGMVAHAPRDRALLGGRRRLVRLALDAEVHDVVPEKLTRVEVPGNLTRVEVPKKISQKVPADGTVVNHNVPSPQCNSIPLLHLIQGSCE